MSNTFRLRAVDPSLRFRVAVGLPGPQGPTGATGATGAAGADGDDAYVYIAYASDDTGTGFTLTFNPSLDYIAIKATDTEIVTPVVGDFAGLWKNYKGATGATGAAGNAATISVGTVDTVNPGDPATVTNSGTSSAAVFDFEIPKGDTGASGGQWFSGATDPDNGNGEDGDFYLQTGTGSTGVLGDVWEKSSGTWAIITNIKGADGAGTGTVTSVDLGVPTGFTSSGGPVTGSGTLTLGYDTGYQGYTSAEASKLSGIASGATANSAASTTETLTGTDSAKFVTPDGLAALWEKGSDVASAGTISLGEGGYFHITGTTTITDIDFATAKDGRSAILEFDGVLTLTHHATTLKLPTGANITTAAGDTCKVVQDNADNVRVVWYQRANGQPLAGGGGDSPIGVHEIWIDASAFVPSGTSGARPTNYNQSGTDVPFSGLAFSTSSSEQAFAKVTPPKSWNAGSFTVIPYWTNTGGGSGQNVRWVFSARAYSNDDNLSSGFSTETQISDDTWIAQNDLHIGPETGSLTADNSPQKTDLIVLRVLRDVNNDNMAGDAILLGVILRFTTDAATDA